MLETVKMFSPLLALLAFCELAAADNLKIDELPGASTFSEWSAYTYQSFFLIFGDYLPTSGQLMFAGLVLAVIVWKSAQKKSRKNKHSSHRSASYERR